MKKLLLILNMIVSVNMFSQTVVKSMPEQWSFFLGEWESQSYNNKYHLSISFNGTANQFEGVLTKNGEMSQTVGFSVGELCWTASPSIDGKTVVLQQKWRTGSNGHSTKEEWKPDAMNMTRTTKDHIITNGGLDFVRILEAPLAAAEGVLPSKTPVSVRFSKALTSEDPIQAEAIVTADIKDASGTIIIANGTPVEVSNSKTPLAPGKGGNITVTFVSVKAIDGQTIRLLGEYVINGKNGASFLVVNGQPVKGKPATISDTTRASGVITSFNYRKQPVVTNPPVVSGTKNNNSTPSAYIGKTLCFQNKHKECDASLGTYVTCNVSLKFTADSVNGWGSCGGCEGVGEYDYKGTYRGDTLFISSYDAMMLGDVTEPEFYGYLIFVIKGDKLYEYDAEEKNGRTIIKNSKAPTIKMIYTKSICH